MARDLTLTVGFRWDDEPGDGSACVVCGEACWLRQWRLVVTLAGKPFGPGGVVVCDACHDDGDDDGD